MTEAPYTRTVQADGSIRLASRDGSFTFARPRPATLLVTVTGHDGGEFGTAALDEITAALQRARPITLFVDTREAISVAPRVREEWTRYFVSNQANLLGVHVLTGSKAVHLTVAVAQHFSATGNLIQLYSDPEVFASKLTK